MRNGEKIFYKDDYTVWVGKYEGVVVNQVEPYSYIKYKEGDEPIELRVAANRPVEEGFEKAYDWSYNEGVDFMPYCFQITKDLDLGDWTNVRLKEGSIIKKGGFIGGSGYNADSAPNTTCTTIENCYVRGSIKGETNVGGIFGGEQGSIQAWNDAYIRNNLFCGKLTVKGTDGIKGGTRGYMKSLNKCNYIENNFYCKE